MDEVLEGVAPAGDLDGDLRRFDLRAELLFLRESGEGVRGCDVGGGEIWIPGEEPIEHEPPTGIGGECPSPVEGGTVAAGDGLERIEQGKGGFEGLALRPSAPMVLVRAARDEAKSMDWRCAALAENASRGDGESRGRSRGADLFVGDQACPRGLELRPAFMNCSGLGLRSRTITGSAAIGIFA